MSFSAPKPSQAQIKLEADQQKLLDEQKAEEEQKRKELEKQRISSLRSKIGSLGSSSSPSNTVSLLGMQTDSTLG